MDPLLPSYQPLPVALSHGEGAWVWDTDGKQYLDALGGIAVTGLGHAHPAITDAITQQASQLLHTSNLYEIPAQRELALLLQRLTGMSQCFFANSGAEANEAAIKLCRLYGHSRDIASPQIIVTDGAFHGRTMATLTASSSRKVQAGYEPLLQGFLRVPFNDLDAILQIAEHRQDICAIFIEPIQGEGGINLPDRDYLKQLRLLCDQRGWLLVLDEVQTGVGRTGQWYAYQHSNILPDLLTTAKALGNGIPIGACIAHGHALGLMHPGAHGSTFGGNPFATTVAKTVLAVIEQDDLLTHIQQQGAYLLNQFQKQLANHPHVNAIRGMGLMLGIELDRPCRPLLTHALAQGILVGMAGTQVIRLLPPYIITQSEADQIITRVCTSINNFYQLA